MNWWYSAFSSSSSSPTFSSTADDNYINNETNNRMSDVVSLFSPRRIVGSHHRHRFTSSRDHQHNNGDDVVQAPSRSISTRPHTLPLPELSVLFKRESRRESAVNQTSKYILPSPEDATRKSQQKKGISKAKRPPSIASSRDGHIKKGETVSAPATPISIKSVFPSASELSSQDVIPGVTYYYQTIPERSIHGCDGSPVHNPQKRTCVKSPLSLGFPMHKNSSIDSPMSRRDSNAQATVATVHPLPLPPRAQISSKPDLVPKTPRQSRWQKGKLIGRGTFGSVYVGSNRETGALCAMKEVEILPDDPKSAECIKQLEQEIVVLSQLKHPNIVQYYGSEIVEERFYIYLEYVHPGSINRYARGHCGGMTESIVRNFTRHIVSGLAYLHSTKTIHRDIKGANLLVDANGVVKLADFGMAKHLNGQVHLSLKGSPYWMAPELLQGEQQKDSSPSVALAIDIWSLGCTIIEMMNGKPPWSEFEGPAAMFKVMKETPPIPETMSADGKDFLRCCFIRNPAERPTATILLEHKFLHNSNHLHHISATTNSLNRMSLMVQNRREHST